MPPRPQACIARLDRLGHTPPDTRFATPKSSLTRAEQAVIGPHYNRDIARMIFLLVCAFAVAACRTGVAAPTSVAPVVERTVPVTVEVTRMVPQPIVVQATPTPVTPCAPQIARNAPQITVGAILPFSSPGALQAGFAMQTALNLAVLSVNEKGGIQGTPLRLVSYDSAGIPERGALFAERLILADCAVGLLGFYHSNVALAVLDVAHRYGTPVIVAEAIADEITARHYPEVFRIAPSASMMAAMPAAWLNDVGDYNQDGALTAVAISDSSSAGVATLDRVAKQFREVDITVETMTVDLPSTVFAGVIARILALERLPDAVFIFVKGAPGLALHAQLLDAGIGPQRATLIVTHHVGLESDRFWEAVPNGAGTIVARMGPWPGAVNPYGLEFAQKYEQQTMRWPEAHAFAAHDALLLLAAAMQSADSLSPDALTAALRATDLELAAGRYSFPITATSPPGADAPAYAFQQWPAPPMLYLQYTARGQRSSEATVIWPPLYRTAALVPPGP